MMFCHICRKKLSPDQAVRMITRKIVVRHDPHQPSPAEFDDLILTPVRHEIGKVSLHIQSAKDAFPQAGQGDDTKTRLFRRLDFELNRKHTRVLIDEGRIYIFRLLDILRSYGSEVKFSFRIMKKASDSAKSAGKTGEAHP